MNISQFCHRWTAYANWRKHNLQSYFMKTIPKAHNSNRFKPKTTHQHRLMTVHLPGKHDSFFSSDLNCQFHLTVAPVSVINYQTFIMIVYVSIWLYNWLHWLLTMMRFIFTHFPAFSSISNYSLICFIQNSAIILLVFVQNSFEERKKRNVIQFWESHSIKLCGDKSFQQFIGIPIIRQKKWI